MRIKSKDYNDKILEVAIRDSDLRISIVLGTSLGQITSVTVDRTRLQPLIDMLERVKSVNSIPDWE